MRENQTKDNDLKRILANINMSENEDEKGTNGNTLGDAEIETIHLYIYKEKPQQTSNIVDADAPKDKTLTCMFFFALFIASLLPIFSIAFQMFVLLNPSTATITLVPIQKELSMKTEIMAISNPGPNEILSVALKPVTFTQSKTSPASGHGHQNAAYAKGTITFYNGSSTSQNVPQGTKLTGKSGVNVVTDDLITSPSATPTTPPTFGSISVNAHAIFTGPGGNIEADDNNSYSLGPSILAQNTYAFRGGIDARDFSFVTSSDIGNVLNPLKAEVSQTVQNQLLSEVTKGQSLIPPSCSIKISPDQKAGDEATQVKVTFSQTCRAMTYDTASLQAKGSQILMSLAQNTLGVHFFPIYGIQTRVVRAAISGVFPIRASISVFIHGTWFYQFIKSDIKFLKAAIAGKPINTALHLVQSLPEVKEVRIHFQGFGNSYYLPKKIIYIHILIIYQLMS